MSFSAEVQALSLGEAASMAAFVDDFEASVADVCLQHDRLSVAMEERVGRLTTWDAEAESRHELVVSAHAALTAVLTTWHNDTEKRLYTQRLMRAYYERVASGAALQSEIDERRARLAHDAASC